MESTIKLTCSPKALGELYDSRAINIRFYEFDIDENGFDPRMLTETEWEDTSKDPWVYRVIIRHDEFGNLSSSYDSLDALVKDIKKREQRYILQFREVRDERRRRA